MADVKVSALPASSSLDGSEGILVVQGGLSRKATAAQVKAYVLAALASGDISDFTEAVQDVLGAAVVAGAGIGVAYDDVAGQVTITGTTNEVIDDRVAALLQAGTNITLSYDDTANTLTIASDATASMPAGSVVGSSLSSYTANADITAIIPIDDTIPQIGEGVQILSVSITPTSITSKIRVRFQGIASLAAAGNWIVAALFNGSASAVRATTIGVATGGYLYSIGLEYEYTPASLSAITFSIRVGPGAAGTLRLNGSVASRYLGGVAAATLVAEEIKA